MIHAEPSDWFQAWEDRRDERIKFRTPATQDGLTITARRTRRSIQHRWSASLISFLDHDGQQTNAVWAECSSFKGSSRWLDGPGGVFYGWHSSAPHLNGGPLISGAAQEGIMMFLEELVAVVAREEASSLASEALPSPLRERERD